MSEDDHDHYGPAAAVTRDRVEAEIEQLFQQAEILALELREEADLLERTAAWRSGGSPNGHRDVYGLKMRALGMHEKSLKMMVLSLRAFKLRELLYAPNEYVDRVIQGRAGRGQGPV